MNKQLDLFENSTNDINAYMSEILNWDYELTPVEIHDNIFFKREDKYKVFQVCGAKSRQAYYLISNSKKDMIVTCGSRVSPQIQIVANICKHLNKKCICFTNYGKITNELSSAISDNALIMQDKHWIYNNVVIYHAKKYCQENPECEYIPFGMESLEAVRQTAYQVKNIPDNIRTIVVVAGSGLNLCGILWGCKIYKKDIHIKALRVGKDINDILFKYAPNDLSKLTIINSGIDYHIQVKNNVLCGIELDSGYEAKCIPFVNNGDLFWIIGKRR